LLLFVWVAATLIVAASCSNEQDTAVQPSDPAVQPSDPAVRPSDPAVDRPGEVEPSDDPADDPADSPDEGSGEFSDEPFERPEVADDPFADPGAPGDPGDDPVADPGDTMDAEPGDTMDADSGDTMDAEPDEEGDSSSPFDVPDDVLSDMDVLPDESGEESKRRPDVIFVPTPQEVVDRMLELAKVTKDDVVYDLGCGDGRIVVTAAKKYGCKAKGFDIDPQRVEESLENVKENEVEHLVEIEEADIFELDLTPASVVTLYLLPDLNVRLIPQLEKLKPGTRIVSHAFNMRGVKPDTVETVDAERGTSHTVYLWTTPLQKEDDADTDDPFGPAQ
ncbi:MAG: methyltransferase domain-containing protein, partial [Thermoguttaceae bacterium]